MERARLGAEKAELELADANAHAQLELARAKVAAVTVERARRDSTIKAALGRALRGRAGRRRILRLAWQRWGTWTRWSTRSVGLACDACPLGALRRAVAATRRLAQSTISTHPDGAS